ncbi:SPW repeat protein [Aureimonas sp. Leaf324]|jgi:hypothetical protein|uniref:SPW repeat protein n=1 Tax=Aureimonas sp. Leaf324 TaxID=1736336 RepID=UPI0006F433F7|nr:SPW repeat protein [Aureimonas sp. Leaf324]KQQ85706.1 hypothetical protein ASF65_03925 [Aureimonas sp. Leaf324]
MNEQRWQDWLVALIGAWLVLSNWILTFQASEPLSALTGRLIFWNSAIVGVVALVLAVMSLTSHKAWEEWVNIVLGLWLAISPWVLGFTNVRNAVLNVTLCGLAIVGSSAWSLRDAGQAGHAR